MSWDRQVATFAETAHAVGSIVATIEDPGRPGLGEWDLHALAAHTLRALLTLESYLEEPVPADEPPLADASAYLAAYLEMRSADPGRVDSAIAERGRSGAASLGIEEVAARFTELSTDLALRLAAAGPDRLIPSPWGVIRLGDYLRTRSFELVAHGLDLAAATGESPHIPDAAIHDALILLIEVAERRGVAPDVVMVLTGRAAPGVLPIVQ